MKKILTFFKWHLLGINNKPGVITAVVPDKITSGHKKVIRFNSKDPDYDVVTFEIILSKKDKKYIELSKVKDIHCNEGVVVFAKEGILDASITLNVTGSDGKGGKTEDNFIITVLKNTERKVPKHEDKNKEVVS